MLTRKPMVLSLAHELFDLARTTDAVGALLDHAIEDFAFDSDQTRLALYRTRAVVELVTSRIVLVRRVVTRQLDPSFAITGRNAAVPGPGHDPDIVLRSRDDPRRRSGR